MNVIYSVGTKIAAGGIGDTAYYGLKAIHKHGYLKKAICISSNKTEIPKSMLRFVPVIPPKPPFLSIHNYYFITTNIFDITGRLYVDSCDIFYGWGGMQLFQMRKAKEYHAVCISNYSSSHILKQTRLLEEEYARFGLKGAVQSEWLIRKSMKETAECDYIAAASQFVKDSLIEYGVEEDKIFIIPFGVELSKFSGKKIRNNNKFVALFTGIVGLRKGIPYLLQAWKELGLKNAELRICGPITPEIKPFLKKYRADSIKILGFVDNVLEEFEKADIFIFPTIEEGSALVTYEAMASGTPLITTTNSGAIAVNDEDGFILPIRDITALKDSIQYLYDNPEETKRMGINARKHVEKYTWEQYGENLVKMFETVVK